MLKGTSTKIGRLIALCRSITFERHLQNRCLPTSQQTDDTQERISYGAVLKKQRSVGKETLDQLFARPLHQQGRKKRAPNDTASVVSSTSGISIEKMDAATPRLCGLLDNLIDHIKSVIRLPGTNKRKCYVCNKEAAHVCTKCIEDPGSNRKSCSGAPLHFSSVNPNNTLKVPCFYQYHNTSFFGKAIIDFRVTNQHKGQMELPDAPELK